MALPGRSLLRAMVRGPHWALRRATIGPRKLRRHASRARKRGEPVRVVFGGHWHPVAGWLLVDERDQDITRSLAFADATVDAVFSEHVVEHVELIDALRFFVEVKRVLRPGGVFRVVVATIDAMMSADFSSAEGRTYLGYTIGHDFSTEVEFVRQIAGESLIEAAPHASFVNFMFYGHGHRFIWTSDLLVEALRWAGFSAPTASAIGEGSNPEIRLERRRRGDYVGPDPAEDRRPGTVFNCDSSVAEAIG